MANEDRVGRVIEMGKVTLRPASGIKAAIKPKQLVNDYILTEDAQVGCYHCSEGDVVTISGDTIKHNFEESPNCWVAQIRKQISEGILVKQE